PESLRWYAAYFLEQIHWQSCCRKWDETGHIRLAYNLLENIIPRKELRDIKHLLIDTLGVVECDYIAKRGKAYGYRLTEHFRDTDLLVCTDEYLNRKVAEARANADKTIQSTQRRLRGNFDLIEFDYPKAADILNSLRPKRKKRNVKLT